MKGSNSSLNKYENQIERASGDTYPIEFKYKVNGSLIDVEEWDLYFTYNETINEVTKAIRIQGIANSLDPEIGKCSFYPREPFSKDITDINNIVDYTPFGSEGLFDYKITRERDFYYFNSSGTYVKINDEYVIYDGSPGQDDNPRFNKFKEIQTHEIGRINIIKNI